MKSNSGTMRPLLLLLTCLTAACAFTDINEDVMQEYGKLTLLRNCFGESIFSRYMKKVQAATAACRNTPYAPERTTSSNRAPQSQKTGIMFTRERVRWLSIKMRLSISNSTCVLQQLGYIDGAHNIQYQTMVDEIKDVERIDKQLQVDLMAAITQCKDFTTCIPLDRIQYPMRPAQIRYLNFSMCRNQGTIAACLKKQFRNELPDFDYLGAQDIIDGVSAADEKMISLLWRNTNTGIF